MRAAYQKQISAPWIRLNQTMAATLLFGAMVPTTTGGDLLPSMSSAVDTPEVARAAWIVLATGPTTPFYESLIRRYHSVFTSFPAIDFMVCLSGSNFTYTRAEAQQLLTNWTSALPGVTIHLVTTDTIVDTFPALSPLPSYEATYGAQETSREYTMRVGSAEYESQKRHELIHSFEWAHHEPTLLSSEPTTGAPGCHTLSRVCCLVSLSRS